MLNNNNKNPYTIQQLKPSNWVETLIFLCITIDFWWSWNMMNRIDNAINWLDLSISWSIISDDETQIPLKLFENSNRKKHVSISFERTSKNDEYVCKWSYSNTQDEFEAKTTKRQLKAVKKKINRNETSHSLVLSYNFIKWIIDLEAFKSQWSLNGTWTCKRCRKTVWTKRKKNNNKISCKYNILDK